MNGKLLYAFVPLSEPPPLLTAAAPTDTMDAAQEGTNGSRLPIGSGHYGRFGTGLI